MTVIMDSIVRKMRPVGLGRRLRWVRLPSRSIVSSISRVLKNYGCRSLKPACRLSVGVDSGNMRRVSRQSMTGRSSRRVNRRKS